MLIEELLYGKSLESEKEIYYDVSSEVEVENFLNDADEEIDVISSLYNSLGKDIAERDLLQEGLEPQFEFNKMDSNIELESFCKLLGTNRKTINKKLRVNSYHSLESSIAAKEFLLQKSLEAFVDTKLHDYVSYLTSYIKTVGMDMRTYKSKGKKLIEEISENEYKVNPKAERSIKADIFLSRLPIIALDNFIRVYNNKTAIKELSNFDDLKCELHNEDGRSISYLNDYKPIGVAGIFKNRGREGSSEFVSRYTVLTLKIPDGEEDILQKVFLSIKNGKTYSKFDDVVLDLYKLDTLYDKHYKIFNSNVSVVLNFIKSSGPRILNGALTGIGAIGGAIGGAVTGGVGEVINGEYNNDDILMNTLTGITNAGKGIAKGFVQGGISGGKKLSNMGFVVKAIVNAKNLRTLSKAQNIYRDIYDVQNELKNCLLKIKR